MRRLVIFSIAVILLNGTSFGQTPAAARAGVARDSTAARARPKVRKEIVKADSARFKEVKLPKLVDLGAGKCIPCKKMAPILEELRKDYAGKLYVVVIDIRQNPGESKKYGIRLIPTQIFYGPDGKELFRHEGFFAKEDILAKWKELGFDITAGKSK